MDLKARLEAIDRKFAAPNYWQEGSENLVTGTASQGRTVRFGPDTKLEPVEPNWIIYDCEIVKCIPILGKPRDKRFKYCEGWTDYKGMGVAVIGYKINDNPPNYCLSVEDFREVLDSCHGAIVGFNSSRFDDRLLAAHGLRIKTGYDLLDEIRQQAGLPTTDTRKQLKGLNSPKGKRRSYKLDTIAKFNGLSGKSMDGGLAPMEWQKGNRQQVIDYCLDDVEITSRILTLGLQGKLQDPNTGERILLPVPPRYREKVANVDVPRESVEIDFAAAIERVEKMAEFGLADPEAHDLDALAEIE